MKKRYSVEENIKIENGKKRLVSESKCRKATYKDIVFDKEVQVFSPDGNYSNIVRIREIINVNGPIKAFVASDGHTYGLEETFVEIKDETV